VNILTPGIGVGGHCIAVDPWFIIDRAKDQAKLIKSAREVNESRPSRVINKVLDACSALDSPRILCLGLAYKPNIDDLRESPAMQIVQQLCLAGVGQILIDEPNIDVLPLKLEKLVKQEEMVGMAEQAASLSPPILVDAVNDKVCCDVIVLLVEHQQYTSQMINRYKNDAIVLTINDF
jgi:UDP-N-acetyl-D-mannosaminuronate dehydrogenase